MLSGLLKKEISPIYSIIALILYSILIATIACLRVGTFLAFLAFFVASLISILLINLYLSLIYYIFLRKMVKFVSILSFLNIISYPFVFFVVAPPFVVLLIILSQIILIGANIGKVIGDYVEGFLIAPVPHLLPTFFLFLLS